MNQNCEHRIQSRFGIKNIIYIRRATIHSTRTVSLGIVDEGEKERKRERTPPVSRCNIDHSVCEPFCPMCIIIHVCTFRAETASCAPLKLQPLFLSFSLSLYSLWSCESPSYIHSLALALVSFYATMHSRVRNVYSIYIYTRYL